MARGQSPEAAVKALKPPPLYKILPEMRRQVSQWNQERLTQALTLLLETEQQAKRSGQPDRALVERTILRLSKAARVGGRR